MNMGSFLRTHSGWILLFTEFTQISAGTFRKFQASLQLLDSEHRHLHYWNDWKLHRFPKQMAFLGKCRLTLSKNESRHLHLSQLTDQSEHSKEHLCNSQDLITETNLCE